MANLKLDYEYPIQELAAILDKQTDNVILYDCGSIFVMMVTLSKFKKMMEDSPQAKISAGFINNIEYFCIEHMFDSRFDSTYVVRNAKTEFLKELIISDSV